MIDTSTAFHRVRAPLALAPLPSRFSHTVLASLRECPRRWQLVRSTWPWPGRYPERAGEVVLRGRVVHRAIEEVVGRLRAAGSPAWGSSGFQEVSRAFLSEARLEAIAAEELAALAANPRYALIDVPRLRQEDCRNSLVRLLRQVWRGSPGSPARAGPRARGSHAGQPRPSPAGASRLPPLVHGDLLAEVALEHPRLPLEGRIDLVEIKDEGDVIVDVKTGAFREAYVGQVRLYALLWWRVTERLPRAVRVVSVDDAPEDVVVTADDLVALESTLAGEVAAWRARISRGPLPARPAAETCRWCPVRQLCDDYWTAPETEAQRWGDGTDSDGLRDLDARGVEWRSAASLLAQARAGVEVSIAAAHGVAFEPRDHGPGTELRVLGVARTDATTFVVVRTSEVFSFPAQAR